MMMVVLENESFSSSSLLVSAASQECGVYLAPSTIPGAGLGMYAGNQEYKKGDVVTDSDLMIPVFELEWHNGHQEFPFLWDEYVWNAEMFPGMEFETEDLDGLHVCSGGMGAAVNCMLSLVNVEDEDESYAVGTSGVDSGESPGAGAFTPFHGRKFLAMQKIEPGAELYASYGESYFEARSAYRDVPMKRHFRSANKLITKFRRLADRLFPEVVETKEDDDDKDDGSSDGANDLKSKVWDLVRDVVRSVPSHSYRHRRILGALPSNVTRLNPIMYDGGTSRQHYNASVRSLDWLEENGQCMDNIKDGISTNPDAGRGAFANRFIPKGGLVAPSPLIQIPYRRVLTMYDGAHNEEDSLARVASRPNHKQLLLNYCFGHRDTTMVLCSYGLMTTLINHGHGEKSNTKIQWSQSMRHPEWRNQTIKSFEMEYHTGLSFDFVALRDIEEDEEIFIDYGDEWEAAWQEHLSSFHPHRRGYLPAFELNEKVDWQIKTMDEFDYDYEGTHTHCRNYYLEMHGIEPLEEYDDADADYSPCRVVKRNHDDSYVAELWDVEFGDFQRIASHDVIGILFDIPRDAFVFTDCPYTRDHHQIWSFRHDMRIPDDMIPDIWKNLNDAKNKTTTQNNDPDSSNSLPSEEKVPKRNSPRTHDPVQEDL
jgi:hypothetical protein